jgi:FlaG/FlaF family flagellin (archaellin)
VAPVVATTGAAVASDAPATAIDAAGTVTDDGGSTISDRGVVYAEVDAGDPTYDDNAGRVEVGAGVGSFTARMEGLAPNTTYVVRAYARNAEGTAYGDTLQVSTE